MVEFPRSTKSIYKKFITQNKTICGGFESRETKEKQRFIPPLLDNLAIPQ